MFSDSLNNYGTLANTNINEVDFALPGTLPTIMNFDEFKATNDTVGKMAFIITDTKTHKTFDILLLNFDKNFLVNF